MKSVFYIMTLINFRLIRLIYENRLSININCLFIFQLFLLVSTLCESGLEIPKFLSCLSKNRGNIYVWGLLVLSCIETPAKVFQYFFTSFVWFVNWSSLICKLYILFLTFSDMSPSFCWSVNCLSCAFQLFVFIYIIYIYYNILYYINIFMYLLFIHVLDMSTSVRAFSIVIYGKFSFIYSISF